VKDRYRVNRVHGVTVRNAEICMFDSVKVKVKFSLDQATKTQRGGRGIALLFL
jgi:hypothetical protein